MPSRAIRVTDPAKPSARVVALPAEQPAEMPARLAPSDVVFVERYAHEGGALSLRIVDLASTRLRRVPIIRTAKAHSYVQFTQLAVRPDRVTFAGQFSGHASPLKGRVEDVDGCEAQGGVECFNTPDTVTLAPTAAVIGTVSFTPAPATRAH